MTPVEAPRYLDLYLEPLNAYLSRAEVTDIYINRPCEVWIETLGGSIERHDAPDLDEAHLWRLARQIANNTHQGISRRRPLLAAMLPDGARVQVVASPATRNGAAFAIRRHVAATVPLQSYQPSASSRAYLEKTRPLEQWTVGNDAVEFLSKAVKQRLNIVISGGTSSGKTTLLNSLIAEIPPKERLVFIEDTPELRIGHLNSVGLIAVRGHEGEAEVTSEDLLQASLRMRPDRIILGELRGREAFTFLRAINTGHPGSLTTVHADSPERALIQLSMMCLQADVGIGYTDVRHLVQSMVDIVVQITRDGAVRSITEVLDCRSA